MNNILPNKVIHCKIQLEKLADLFTNLLQTEARVALASNIHWEGIFS